MTSDSEETQQETVDSKQDVRVDDDSQQENTDGTLTSHLPAAP